jgi:hypothetical protein
MDYRRREAALPGDGHFLRDHRLDAAAHVARELVRAGVEEDLRDAVGPAPCSSLSVRLNACLKKAAAAVSGRARQES